MGGELDGVLISLESRETENLCPSLTENFSTLVISEAFLGRNSFQDIYLKFYYGKVCKIFLEKAFENSKNFCQSFCVSLAPGRFVSKYLHFH